MGTKFSLKDPNPPVWFKFDESDPASGEIGIRVLNKAERDRINGKAVKKKVEYKHGQRFEVIETNEDLFSELLWDYCISDWKDLEDDDGEIIECNTENKIFLMKKNPGFAMLVGQCLEALAQIEESRVKMIEKNLSSGQNGSELSPHVKNAES